MPRRQLLAGMAGLAGTAAAASCGLLSGRAFALAQQNWPLWVVEGSSTQVYLTGETPPRRNAWSDSRIEHLLPSCAALWTETSQIRHAKTGDLVGRWGMDSSAPLSQRLAAADLARLQQAATLAQLPLESVQQFRPWLVAFALEEAYYGAMNLPEKGTVEKVLEARAETAAVAHSSEFPSVDDVFAFMGAMPAQADVQYLRYTLDHILAGPEQNEDVYSAWARGDFRGATAFVNHMREQHAELYSLHVAGRNRNWLPRFDAMLGKTQPSMVVVGLYHLVGPDSLLLQLRSHGLSVRAL